MWLLDLMFFFFKQKTAYDMLISDWSSDVCSSDLGYSMLFIYKSRHVNYGRERVVFRCKMENIIDTYRNRIKAMGYEPRRQEDIPDVMAAYCEAIANCKIEGLDRKSVV